MEEREPRWRSVLGNIEWGWIAGFILAAGVIAFSIWMFSRDGDGTQNPSPDTEEEDTLNVKRSMAAQIDLQQLEDSLLSLDSAKLITEYSGDEAHRVNQVNPAKDTRQVDIENIIESCYSNLAPLFTSSEYILDDPLPEEALEIDENIRLIELYLISDKERAIERILGAYPGMAYDEIERIVENSDPYQKFTIQASRIVRDLKKAGTRLSGGTQ